MEQEWSTELATIWADDIASGVLEISQLLEWWPTKQDWLNFDKQNSENRDLSELEAKIKRSFTDEDEFYRLIKAFKAGDASAHSTVFSYFPGKNRKRIVELFDKYILPDATERKLYRSIRHVLKDKDFNIEIRKIRKKWGIPISGYTLSARKELEDKDYIWGDVTKLAAQYSLGLGGKHVIKQYALYNKVSSDHIFTDPLCDLLDRMEKIESQQVHWTPSSKIIAKENRVLFPIAIAVSPYAKISDIHFYIDKNAQDIKQMQSRYQKKRFSIGRVKFRIMERKYDYIWKNQGIRPAKKLASMVSLEFKTTHDEIYIRNIISRENKRRGQP